MVKRGNGQNRHYRCQDNPNGIEIEIQGILNILVEKSVGGGSQLCQQKGESQDEGSRLVSKQQDQCSAYKGHDEIRQIAGRLPGAWL